MAKDLKAWLMEKTQGPHRKKCNHYLRANVGTLRRQNCSEMEHCDHSTVPRCQQADAKEQGLTMDTVLENLH